MDAKEAEFEVVSTREEKKEPAVFQGYSGALSEEVLKRAEATVPMINRVKSIALGVTNHKDWERFGDKAYLNESGSKKLAALFGVSIEAVGPIIEKNSRTESGKPVRIYTATVRASLNGRSVEEQGSADSQDDFFLYRWRDGKREELPFDELDFGSIRKKAYTNALGRAVKSLLGYGTVLWDEVGGHVKQAEKVAQINFKVEAPKTTQTVGERNIRDDLKRMLMDLANQDEADAASILERETSFQGKDGNSVKGFSDPYNPKISDKWIRGAHHKIKELWEPTFGSPPEEPGANG